MSLLCNGFKMSKRAAGGGFDPLSLSPALWLSDTGSDPATWPDISGNERHATQSDPTRRPAIITSALNGRQVRRFNGINNWLYGGGGALLNSRTSQGHIFAVVGSPTKTKSAICSTRDPYDRGWTLRANSSAELIYFHTTYGSMKVAVTGWPAIIEVTRSGDVATIGVNGIFSAPVNMVNFSAGSVTLIGTEIVGDSLFGGDMAELMVVESGPQTTLEESYRNHLAAKYGISVA